MLGIPLTLAALGGSLIAKGLEGKTARSGKVKQYPTMTPGQIQSSDWARQQAQDQISNPYKGFEPIQAYQENRFNTRTVPTLAERFTSMGSGSALSSPAFQSDLKNTSEDFRLGLGALQSEYGLKNQALGQNLMRFGMQPQFENKYLAGGPTFASGMLGGVSNILGSVGTMGMSQLMNPSAASGSNAAPERYIPGMMGGQPNYDYAGEPISNLPAGMQQPEDIGYGEEFKRLSAGTSPSTASGNRMGYGGNPALQDAIQQLLATNPGGGPGLRQGIQGLLSNYAQQAPQAQTARKPYTQPSLGFNDMRTMERLFPGFSVGR